ncbi:MAG: hypothetical protein ACKOZU_03210 [Planctomycetaceae bacterium]
MIPHRILAGMTAQGSHRRLAARAWLAATCLCCVAAVSAADLADSLGEPSSESTVDPAPTPDPLAGSPWVDPATEGPDAERILASLLPPRSDSPADWSAPLEPLHDCGEPRVLEPCVPPPPCHPALPPQPFDLVGVRGDPTCGPIYGGPCAPRTGSHDAGRLPRLHRVPDRLFDWFYRSR